MHAPTSAEIRYWSRVNFEEYGFGEPPHLDDETGEAVLPKQTELDEAIVLPATPLTVPSTTGFPASGTVLLVYGSRLALVDYTSITATTFVGASGGSGSFPEGSEVHEYLADRLDVLLHRSISEFVRKTGLALLEATAEEEPLVTECLQLLTEYRGAASQQEITETGADYDMIGNFSASDYSETRRQDNRRPLVLHPVPRINALMLHLMTDEKQAESGGEAPAVQAEDPVDWDSARNIIDAQRTGYYDPGYGFPWQGWT